MTASVTSTEAQEGPVTSGFWALTLGSIGVVFGDIGTSPLYAFREAVAGAAHGQPVTRDIVLGVLVADPVGAVHRRHRQIRAAAAARRQQRRGRHALADGARPARARPPELAVAGARRGRRLDVHRRFHDHAGDFGAVGGRRPQARDAGARALRGAADGLHSGRAVLGAEQRHRARRLRFRAGHGGLVRHRWRCWASCTSATIPSVLAAINPWYAHPIPAVARHHRPGDAGRGVSGGDRRRGALCRSRPFRPQADPVRLDVLRAAGAADQLFRAGRAGAVRSRPRSRTRSTAWCRRSCCCRWWCWRPRRP